MPAFSYLQIKERMRRVGVSHADMAALIGVSEKTVTRQLNGLQSMKPTPALLNMLAALEEIERTGKLSQFLESAVSDKSRFP